jgi:hypothetical protein
MTTLILIFYRLIIGLLTPGLLVVLGLEHFFSLSFNSELKFFIMILTSIVPWIILGFSIRANKKKWTVFAGSFILMYTVCGAVYRLWLILVVGT